MIKLVSLIFTLTIILTNNFARGEIKESLTTAFHNLLDEIGFSPSCVSQTLALCENSKGEPLLLRLKTPLQLMQNWANNLKEVDKRPRNCADHFNLGDKESGVRTVYPFSCCENKAISVFCDQTTDEGGWTVIQRRDALPQRENFMRNWVEYQLGFGILTGEFWLGLNTIHALVSDDLMELRVDLEDFEGKKRWAKYEYFYIRDATEKYRLDFGEYSGNAGDSFAYHKGQMFSTKDQDNDVWAANNCAVSQRGGWWYKSCRHCNLNSYQYEGNHTSNGNGDGINWKGFRGDNYSLKKTSLSLRPKFQNSN